MLATPNSRYTLMPDFLPVEDPVLVFAIVALLILLAPVVMARWRLPGTVGLLLAGAILGPNALGVLARDQSFVLLGTVGLLYIMFSAALEIDMLVLKRSRTHSLVFGLLTFGIPQGIGMVVAHYVLGFAWSAAILLASLFASHTLLAYPVASRLGITRNRAVTAAVGGTIITDTLALLVLAVVAGAARGEMNDTFWLRLGVSLGLYFTAILVGLPLLARWFFRHVGRNGVAEFVFVLAGVFGCASLAHVAGSDPVVGAFLAGLALNRLIPHNGTLMNRIQFTGEAIFVPFFLLSVGMLLDLRVLAADPRAAAIAIGMTATVIFTKWLAAHATRVFLRYTRAQAGVVFGLSLSQAAATLAATVVGYEIGLFDDAVVNGAIMMILITCLIAPWQVERHGREVALATQEEPKELTARPQRILVALSERTAPEPMLELAMLLRDPGAQQPVFPLTVVEEGGEGSGGMLAAEHTLARAVGVLSAADVPVHPLTRIDFGLAVGLLRARKELRGTEVILGWSDRTAAPDFFFGSVLENMLEDRDFTLVLSRQHGALAQVRRVIFALPPDAHHEPGFAVAVALVKRLAHQLGAPILLVAQESGYELVRKRIAGTKPVGDVSGLSVPRWSGVLRALGGCVKEDDLIVLYGARVGGVAWRTAMGSLRTRIAAHFPATGILVIYPAEPSDDQTVTLELAASALA